MATQALSTGVTAPITKPSRFSKRTQEWIAGLIFVAPAVVIIAVFVLIPMVLALGVSFTDWTGIQTLDHANFVGIQQYQHLLFEDGPLRNDFFMALKNTVYYSLGVVPAQTIIALLLAIIVNQKFLKAKGFFRTAFYFPSITSSVAISVVFLWLFNKDGIINKVAGLNVTWTDDLHGVFQNFLGLFGITIRNAPGFLIHTTVFGQTLWNWMSGPSVSMLAIMILATWTTVGTLMLIFLAALQDVPAPLYEAAAVDGATRWQIFRKITVPMLRPTTFFVITIGLIGTLQMFDQSYIISGGTGNPAGTTLSVALVVYRNAFGSFNAGLGAATAFILFVIIMVFTLIQRRITGNGSNT